VIALPFLAALLVAVNAGIAWAEPTPITIGSFVFTLTMFGITLAMSLFTLRTRSR
jgi:hypothetical protein